ncbi:MAG: ECF-type sigma factor [Pirellula sp.]
MLHSSEQLFSLVYAELRKLAESRLRNESPGQTLQPTALVHEVYLRLVVPAEGQNWDNSSHFFAAAAQAMRRVLIDHARKKIAEKRGGGFQRIDIQLDDMQMQIDDQRLLNLDQALTELAKEDPIKAKLIELRFFTGLSADQTCNVLQISRATAHRYWKQAQAWLFLRLRDN